MVPPADCVGLVSVSCLDLLRLVPWLDFQTQSVGLDAQQTMFEAQQANCMILRMTSPLNISGRKTAHTHFAYNHRSGQKKSAVSGTSMVSS